MYRFRHTYRTTIGGCATLAALFGLNAWGADDAINRRVQDLEAKVKAMEATKAGAPSDAKAGADGFHLKSADGAFQLRIGGYLQADARFYLDDETSNGAVDNFLLRRVRPILEGVVFNKFGFKIMPDFGASTSTSTPTIQDAYAEAKLSPGFRIRAGKFKAPSGLERLQAPTDMMFMERGLPSQLTPSRDVGLQIHGDIFSATTQYALGAFNGVLDGSSGDSDNNQGKDLFLRLFTQPFKNSDSKGLKGFGIGAFGSTGDQKGSTTSANLSTYKTVGQQTFLSYVSGAFAGGKRDRYGPAFYYYAGPFGLIGEYNMMSQEITRSGTRQKIEHQAWGVSAELVLTGEAASFKGVAPDSPAGTGGNGAFSLAARYGQFETDEDAYAGASPVASRASSASEATEMGVGLNWYANRFTRVTLDYHQTEFKDGAAAGDRPTEKVLMTRFQIGF
ncbi:MAG: OprO/OprP family phosphate-selective porin [Burkholderiales bacterium]